MIVISNDNRNITKLLLICILRLKFLSNIIPISVSVSRSKISINPHPTSSTTSSSTSTSPAYKKNTRKIVFLCFLTPFDFDKNFYWYKADVGGADFRKKRFKCKKLKRLKCV